MAGEKERQIRLLSHQVLEFRDRRLVFRRRRHCWRRWHLHRMETGWTASESPAQCSDNHHDTSNQLIYTRAKS